MSFLPSDLQFGSKYPKPNPINGMGMTSSNSLLNALSRYNGNFEPYTPIATSGSSLVPGSISQQILDMPMSNPNLGGGSGVVGAIGGAKSGGGLFGGMSGMDKANMALTGLQTLGSLWGAFQSMKLANKQYKFTKNVTSTNLNNQIKSYNTTLDDKARSRGKVESQSAQQTQDYINKNKLANFKG